MSGSVVVDKPRSPVDMGGAVACGAPSRNATAPHATSHQAAGSLPVSPYAGAHTRGVRLVCGVSAMATDGMDAGVSE